MAIEDPQLFPEAYRSTLATGTRQLLPAVRRWRWLLLLVVTGLLLASFPLFWRAVAPLASALSTPPAATPAAPSVSGS